MSYLKPPTQLTLFLKKWWKPIAFTASFFAVVTFPFWLNFAVHQATESYLTNLNGAQVNIRDLDVSLLRGSCRIQGLEVTHHTHPVRNLIEVDEIKFTFERFSLLSMRLVIPELDIEGVRYNTARESSGILDFHDTNALPPTALLDRISPAVYDSVRTSMGETPLRNLAQLQRGLAMRTTVDPFQQQTIIHKEIKAIELELDRKMLQWDLENEKITRGEFSPTEKINRLQNLQLAVEKDAKELGTKVDHIFDRIPEDVRGILSKLGVPVLHTPDFTQQLLGRRTLNHLERVAYWVELSRRKMGAPNLNWMLTSSLTPGSDSAVTTGKPSPRFWVKKARIRSSADVDHHKGNIQGEISNLASEPLGASLPLIVDIQADFPGSHIRGLKAHALVNHSSAQPEEQAELTIESFPLTDWSVEKSPELDVSIATAQAKLHFKTAFEGVNQNSTWTLSLKKAEFATSSQYPLMDRILRDVFSRFGGEVNLTGVVSGTHQNLTFAVESNLGRELAVALGENFKLTLQSAEETIQDNLHERFSPQVKRLENRIETSTGRYKRRLGDSIALLGGKSNS